MIPSTLDTSALEDARNRFAGLSRFDATVEPCRVLYQAKVTQAPIVTVYQTAYERQIARRRGELVAPGRRGRPAGVNGDYGQGKCIICGTPFNKHCHNADTCSDECRRKRSNRKKAGPKKGRYTLETCPHDSGWTPHVPGREICRGCWRKTRRVSA